MALLTGLMRLGRDAEIRQAREGESVANLALAYNYGQRGQDGNRPTQWIDAALWGKRAEALAQYLTKGTAVSVTLSDVYVRTYTKKDGGQGVSLCGRVMDIEFAGGGEKVGGGSPRAGAATAQRQQPAPAPADDFGDQDIPF